MLLVPLDHVSLLTGLWFIMLFGQEYLSAFTKAMCRKPFAAEKSFIPFNQSVGLGNDVERFHLPGSIACCNLTIDPRFLLASPPRDHKPLLFFETQQIGQAVPRAVMVYEGISQTTLEFVNAKCKC